MALIWVDGPWIADTSAWARARNPAVAPQWKGCRRSRADHRLPCDHTGVALRRTGPRPRRYRRRRSDRPATGPNHRTVTDAAIRAVQDLASHNAAGAHRVRVPDALIAAAAAERGFAVLHYDHHFDKLATVLSFTSQWVAEPGSMD